MACSRSAASSASCWAPSPCTPRPGRRRRRTSRSRRHSSSGWRSRRPPTSRSSSSRHPGQAAELFAGAFGAGGTSTVPAGSDAVVKSPLAPVGRRVRGRRGLVGTVDRRKRDRAGRTRPRRRPGRAYPHRRARSPRRPDGGAEPPVNSDQVLPAAIVVVIVIFIIVALVRIATRRRGANEDAFGAGGTSQVAVGTRGVAKTDLAPSGVVLVVSEQWTAQIAQRRDDRIGTDRPGRRPGRAHPHRRSRTRRPED